MRTNVIPVPTGASLCSPVNKPSDTQHSWEEQINFPVKQFKDLVATLKAMEKSEGIAKKRSLGLYLFQIYVTVAKQAVNTPDICIRGA